MSSSGSLRRAKSLLYPPDIAALYNLHSEKSTAVNDALQYLLTASGCRPLSPSWDEALRANRLSMWLHQVIAFRDALDLFISWGKRAAREAGQQLPRVPKKSPPAWVSGSARTVHADMARLGVWLRLDREEQFEWECQVAPRHYVWRDAWVHHGGRLRHLCAEVFKYFAERSAVEELDSIAYPLDNAWREARLSFSKTVQILACAAQSTRLTTWNSARLAPLGRSLLLP